MKTGMVLGCLTALIFSGCSAAKTADPGRLEKPERFDNVTPRGCYDGDTCYFDIADIPLFGRSAPVRVLNIDTPEIKGQCPEEIEAAERARDAMLEWLQAAERVDLVGVAGLDKYRRILAHIEADGEDLGERLVTRGLARPWDAKRWGQWCGPDARK